jgi:hypothetical protein
MDLPPYSVVNFIPQNSIDAKENRLFYPLMTRKMGLRRAFIG